MLDVIVIGGGFSGVAAAKKLHENNVSFQLLEARDRLGGRVHTQHFEDGKMLEVGGQWIGPTQDRMYELVREYGLTYFETYNEGINLLDIKGKIAKYKGLIPKLNPISLLSLEWMIRRLESMARKIDTQRPWKTPTANSWDHQTLEQFVKKNAWTSAAYQVMKAGLETVYACELNEISLLHALFYIRSGNNLNCLLSIEKGAQLHRIKEGMQTLIEKMAEPFMDQVLLDHPVQKILWSHDEVSIITDNKTLHAKKLILAIPPIQSSKICFEPSLPIRKKQLLDRIPMGIAGKVLFVYDRPFWRVNGYSGQVVSDQLTPFQTFFDVSPADGSFGVLLAFCLADRARSFFSLDEESRKTEAIKYVSRYFGEQATHPTQYLDHNWASEPWSQGCYAGLYGTGNWTSFQNELANPTGAIHWAGTETSDSWYGYIEGAVRAGERAATEIVRS